MYFITSTTPSIKIDHRCFGFYDSFNKAWEAVKENRMNMHECLYTNLVIEEINEGIHPQVVNEWWYKWENNGWAKCEKPERFTGIVNFALG